MALPKPQLNGDVLAYDEIQTDEINLYQGGYATTKSTGATISTGGVTYHEQMVDVVFDKPFTGRTPSLGLSINSPSSWGINCGYTGVSLTGFRLFVWRINAFDTTVSWVANPR